MGILIILTFLLQLYATQSKISVRKGGMGFFSEYKWARKTSLICILLEIPLVIKMYFIPSNWDIFIFCGWFVFYLFFSLWVEGKKTGKDWKKL